VQQVERLTQFLAEQLFTTIDTPSPVSAASDAGSAWEPDGDEIRRLAGRAALLCKADLSTGMVGEFPELQGVMGRYYALQDGEDPRVADAIADHYKPQGPNDTCPTAPVSVILALADKLDALAAFFAIGEKPTGSRDPFALRRAALGAIRLLIDNNLRLSLSDIFFFVGAEVLHVPHTAVLNHELKQFIFERLRVHLRDTGARHDLIAAATAGEDDIVRLLRRLRALESFVNSEDGANLLTAYRRASNIVEIEQRKDRVKYDQDVDRPGFTQPEEGRLDDRLTQLDLLLGGILHGEHFEDAMAALATLRPPVDEFFARVTVNAPEPRLRENRLRLLSRIRAVMNQVADFSQIEG
jgi:glycyl-tRNA synthetase beta chain